jgi:hypothetical protein
MDTEMLVVQILRIVGHDELWQGQCRELFIIIATSTLAHYWPRGTMSAGRTDELFQID